MHLFVKQICIFLLFLVYIKPISRFHRSYFASTRLCFQRLLHQVTFRNSSVIWPILYENMQHPLLCRYGIRIHFCNLSFFNWYGENTFSPRSNSQSFNWWANIIIIFFTVLRFSNQIGLSSSEKLPACFSSPLFSSWSSAGRVQTRRDAMEG